NRLKPGGLMVQWFHVYEMHDGIVDLVLRTFGSVFPSMEIWDSGAGDVILVGSNQPWDSSVEHLRVAYGREQVRQDLAAIGVDSPEAFLAGNLLHNGQRLRFRARARFNRIISRCWNTKRRWRFLSAGPLRLSTGSM